MSRDTRSECDAAEDDEDDDDAVFGATSTTNNPFAADNADLTDDVTNDATSTAAALGFDVGFNPFQTITDEDTEAEAGVFDPFQTIHDDDALNVPFSSTERDTDDDVTSPSRCVGPLLTPRVLSKGK